MKPSSIHLPAYSQKHLSSKNERKAVGLGVCPKLEIEQAMNERESERKYRVTSVFMVEEMVPVLEVPLGAGLIWAQPSTSSRSNVSCTSSTRPKPSNEL